MSDPVPPRGPRPRLDRDQIVRAATELISEQGVDGLTMRRVGQALGVEAMALYRYVSGREELLEAVIDHLLSSVARQVTDLQPTSWQGYLQTLAHEMRRMAQEHPAAFPLAATRHPAAPWLRPPLRSIELVENFLLALTDAGFDDAGAVDAYKLFTTFLVGSLLLEVAAHGSDIADADTAKVEERETSLREPLAKAPHVVRMRDRLSQDSSTQEFEVGLEALIDRIERTF